MHFESPWSFLLLLIIPILIWLSHVRVLPGTIRFPTVKNAAGAGKSLRQRFIWFPVFLRVLALICLTIALARPQMGVEHIREITQGIAIEMVVDRSGSMGAEMEYKGEKMNRLEVVKRVFQEFVIGSGRNLTGRPDDLIGIVSFARYPDTTCPLTLSHGVLKPFMDSIKVVTNRSEDGTAIGDALALAAARLKTADEETDFQKKMGIEPYKIKSKIIILLSDGENNAGRRDPIQAAEMASKWGIKIYAIAIGGGNSVASIQTPFGVYQVPMRQSVDVDTLDAIAKKTGGFFRMAEDEESLREIYTEIDTMEKAEIESVTFVNYKEAFLPWAFSALIFTGFEILLTATIFRKIP